MINFEILREQIKSHGLFPVALEGILKGMSS